MNLLVALALNKPFRRKNSSSGWIDPAFVKLELTKDDLLSGDWEVPAELVKVDLQDAREKLQAVGFTLAQIRTIAEQLRALSK